METHKVDTANSGKTKWKYVNPELGKKFLSVETLYGVPKAISYGKEKVQTANIKYGNENCSGMNQ